MLNEFGMTAANARRSRPRKRLYRNQCSCYVLFVSLPDFLQFTPVSVRGRSRRWEPGRQVEFIAALARGVPLDEAARLVGRSRSTAYALRRQPGAESFTAAWVAALNHAKARRRARRDESGG
jgi:hypothetical protein